MLVRIKGLNSIWKLEKTVGDQAYLVPQNGAWGLFCVVNERDIEKIEQKDDTKKWYQQIHIYNKR